MIAIKDDFRLVRQLRAIKDNSFLAIVVILLKNNFRRVTFFYDVNNDFLISLVILPVAIKDEFLTSLVILPVAVKDDLLC